MLTTVNNLFFSLENNSNYQIWRQQKLANYPRSIQELIVPIKNPYQLTSQEHSALLSCCRQANMVVYQLDGAVTVDKSALHALATQLQLHRLDHNYCADEDGVAAIQVTEGHSHEFIPYTNQPINWHTDGYYNLLTHQVHAMILHCSRPAITGGENQLLDHEIAYLYLRDANPDYIAVFMEADVMTIPAHWEDGVERRPVQTGPVFAIDSTTGTLHMRYTARARNIIWKNHPLVTKALAYLSELFHSDSPYIFRHRLMANQGIICNNVLHTRTGFTDSALPEQKRLLYRMRFYDRIEGT